MPDVPALFNSACCCAVRMPIPHGVSFAVQLLIEAQNRSNLLCTQFPAKSLRALPGIALAVQICRSFTYMQF
ncbi:hypothetical protein [Rhizobium ruizarguesonis]|uniref:hypothetical protein n=1 Tax=Rhizobium ruizarguesonis TaxID=2081791 RepID=UPI0010318ACB|nr:hypothetical protein [Rhizobium ruizarguesonis]NEI27798.1 hypothetical protein [Rhizobium ruizarguesonis]TAY92834.1 hypothetical protein ELH85_06480 [Rhizobium ruizarguesonis]TAZ77606.1 hypothetical protein ELH68_07440 [Rhizobium ruizarguesonis]TBA03983.1 hypothetical protein ELH64_05995 [Rhizobium ruizarguesonis]TBA25393.1 hypothetical protein ELH61_06135 [Rhizobium ruizarguesonis]